MRIGFLERAVCDSEEVEIVFPRSSAVALGDVRVNRPGAPADLAGEFEALFGREVLGQGMDVAGEFNCLLPDEEIAVGTDRHDHYAKQEVVFGRRGQEVWRFSGVQVCGKNLENRVEACWQAGVISLSRYRGRTLVSAVCWRCIEDEYLKRMIQEDGSLDECSLCGRSDAQTFGPEKLAEVVAPIMQEHFALGPEVKRFGEDDSEWWEQEGDPLSHHLQEVIGTYLGFEEEIVRALEDNEDVRPQDGEEAFFDRSQEYVPTRIRPYRYMELWDYALDELKHRRRFFSSTAKELFDELFDGVENRWWANAEEDRNVVRSFPVGSEFYRARICSSLSTLKEVLGDPFKNVGPPPTEGARSGRMNPEGVPVFYGSLDSETCVAETRPALGNETAVIKIRTTKVLRLLDFSRLGESYTQLSYFQPDFVAQCEKGAFLRRLQRLISQPIVPGRESDYVITQTLAEYLAHVYRPSFDGILFDSVQRRQGTNMVLFPDVQGGFPLSYVDESISLYSTSSIEYSHDRVYVRLMDDGEVYSDRDYEDEE